MILKVFALLMLRYNSDCLYSVTLSCPTLCYPMNCSLTGSSVHGILQARILEWLPFSSPGDLPRSWIKPVSPALVGRWMLYHWATRKAPSSLYLNLFLIFNGVNFIKCFPYSIFYFKYDFSVVLKFMSVISPGLKCFNTASSLNLII